MGDFNRERTAVNNRITVYAPDGSKIAVYEGDVYCYYEDYKNSGLIHFKDANGKHHRVGLGCGITIEEI